MRCVLFDRPGKIVLTGVKRNGVAQYSDVGHVEGFISETMQDAASCTIND